MTEATADSNPARELRNKKCSASGPPIANRNDPILLKMGHSQSRPEWTRSKTTSTCITLFVFACGHMNVPRKMRAFVHLV